MKVNEWVLNLNDSWLCFLILLLRKTTRDRSTSWWTLSFLIFTLNAIFQLLLSESDRISLQIRSQIRQVSMSTWTEHSSKLWRRFLNEKISSSIRLEIFLWSLRTTQKEVSQWTKISMMSIFKTVEKQTSYLLTMLIYKCETRLWSRIFEVLSIWIMRESKNYHTDYQESPFRSEKFNSFSFFILWRDSIL